MSDNLPVHVPLTEQQGQIPARRGLPVRTYPSRRLSRRAGTRIHESPEPQVLACANARESWAAGFSLRASTKVGDATAILPSRHGPDESGGKLAALGSLTFAIGDPGAPGFAIRIHAPVRNMV